MSVRLVGPDGKPYTLDSDRPEDLAEVLRQGYKQQLADTSTTASRAFDAVGSAIGGGLSGLSGGVSDALLAGADPLVGHELERVKEAHPLIHGAANLAGAVFSPLNKLAAPIEGALGATSVVGKIASKGVSNAAVGTLFGAGNTLSDAALGDHDLTAQKLVAGAGLGSVLGLGGGLFGGALDEGIQALPKLGKAVAGADSGLKDFADDRWLKAGGAIQSDIRKIPEVERPAVAEEIRKAMTGSGVLPNSLEEAAANVASEREATAKTLLHAVGVGDAGGLKPGMNQEQALDAIGKALEENGNRITQVLKAADATGATPSYATTLARFDTFEQGLNLAEKDLIAGDLKKVRGYLTDMGSQPPGSPTNNFSALNSIKSTIQKDTNWTADGAAKFGLKRQLAGILRDEIDTQLAPQIGSDLSKSFLDSKAAFGALSNAEEALGKKSATGADAIRSLVEGATLAQPSFAGRLHALDRASQLISHGIDRHLGNRFISPSDYLTGIGAGAIAGGPVGALAGLGSAIGHKVLREKGSAIIAKVADHIAGNASLAPVAAGFVNKLKTAAPMMGEYAQPLINAASQSAAHALATHMTYARADPQYSAVASAAGFTPESDEQHGFALQKAHSLSTIAGQTQAHDETVSRRMAGVMKAERAPVASTVLSTQDFGAKRMRRDASDSHDQRVTEIRQLAADPQALLDRVTANIGHLSGMAPGVTGAVTALAHTAVSYLAAQSTTPPKAGPLAPEWTTTEAERHAFKAKLETVQDPMSVLKHAASGTLTPDRMRALHAVYPRLAQQFADAALEQMINHPKAVPYRARLMLGMLSGSDPDGSIKATVSNQAAIHAGSTKPSTQGAPGSKGAKALDLADRSAMPGNRKELETDS